MHSKFSTKLTRGKYIVTCFEWVVWTVSQCKKFKLGSKLYHFIMTGSRRFVKF